jgi:predicted nucleotidyltransferase
MDLPREALLAELRALRPTLERGGVSRMALFGSRARMDNRPDSDVDLMIDVAEGRKFSLIDLVAVAQTIEDRVGLPANIFIREGLECDFLRVAETDELDVF